MRFATTPGAYGSFSAGYPALLVRPVARGSAKLRVAAVIASRFTDRPFTIRQIADHCPVSRDRIRDVLHEMCAVDGRIERCGTSWDGSIRWQIRRPT